MNLSPKSKKNSTNTIPRSGNVKDKRGDPEKIMPVDADLVEKIDEIIRSYDISYDRCPRFFDVCTGIILFSKMIREELMKQGINRILNERFPIIFFF